MLAGTGSPEFQKGISTIWRGQWGWKQGPSAAAIPLNDDPSHKHNGIIQNPYHCECHAVNLMFVFGLVLPERAVPRERRKIKALIWCVGKQGEKGMEGNRDMSTRQHMGEWD